MTGLSAPRSRSQSSQRSIQVQQDKSLLRILGPVFPTRFRIATGCAFRSILPGKSCFLHPLFSYLKSDEEAVVGRNERVGFPDGGGVGKGLAGNTEAPVKS